MAVGDSVSVGGWAAAVVVAAAAMADWVALTAVWSADAMVAVGLLVGSKFVVSVLMAEDARLLVGTCPATPATESGVLSAISGAGVVTGMLSAGLKGQ